MPLLNRMPIPARAMVLALAGATAVLLGACSPTVADAPQQQASAMAAEMAVDGALAAVTATPGTPVPIPPAITRLADRHAQCLHFAGEINGDQSEADRVVTKTMDELGCATVEEDMRKARARYKDQAAVLQVLQAAGE